MLDWIAAYDEWFAILGIVSLVFFLGSVFVVPWNILSLPADYFMHTPADTRKLNIGRAFLHIGKNVLGALFIVIGLLMLILPGQGILTLLLGFSLIDFPAKRAVQVRLLRMRRVRRAVDWIRLRGKRRPLKIPDC